MTSAVTPGSKIAVIGGGVAGIVASYLLQEKFDVTLFEAQPRLGGHTNTVTITSGPDAGLAVDTGFIVLNDRNYPLFTEFLNRLGVGVRYSDMSFSYECRQTGFTYAGTNLGGLFAQRRNIASPRFYRFLGELVRFAREGRRILDSEKDTDSLALGTLIERGRYSAQMRDAYLLPMGAAIWSSPPKEILEFPARSFLSFFSNHGLLSLFDRPRWQTVIGGSQSYVAAFLKMFRGALRLGAPIRQVSSDEVGVNVIEEGRGRERFDACVLCTHADITAALIADPDPLEAELLGALRYQRNDTFLHTDASRLPLNRRAWASWNYVRDGDPSAPVAVTYHMNRLQGFQSSREYCVTLNPQRPIAAEHLIAHFVYDHPVYDAASLRSQKRLDQLQGRRRRFYCGSYFGYGFHEDAVRSAVRVGEALGVRL